MKRCCIASDISVHDVFNTDSRPLADISFSPLHHSSTSFIPSLSCGQTFPEDQGSTKKHNWQSRTASSSSLLISFRSQQRIQLNHPTCNNLPANKSSLILKHRSLRFNLTTWSSKIITSILCHD